MDLSTRDYLMKAMLEAQEMVRDHQRFSETTDDKEAAKAFKHFAEQEGLKANAIKDMVQRYDG